MKVLFSNIIVLLVFSGCYSQRAAQGLSHGEINIASSLTVNTIRYGITDNIEMRASHVMVYTREPKYNYDVFVHSHSDSNFVNYGIMLGHVVSPVFKPEIYSGFILSKSFTSYFTPYISYIYPFKKSTYYGDDAVGEYLAIGSEWTISLTKSRSIKLLFIPEMEYLNLDGVGKIFDPDIGTLTVGLSIDFQKLFAP